MVTKLKYITFVFENCEYITIDGKYIGHFLVDDIKTRIARVASNSISKQEIAKTFAIEIHKDADRERYPFDDMVFAGKHTVFDRVKLYNDITAIEFVLEEIYPEDEKNPYTEEYNYLVTWTGGDCTNDVQANYVSNLGHLYIVIKENANFSDFFDLEELNDEESMKFHFTMLDVGDSNE